MHIPGVGPFDVIDPYDGQLRCKIVKRPSLFADELSGPVVLHSHFRLESTRNFTFKEWTVEQISPTVGPLRGGTRMTLYGENLNVGTLATVHVGDVSCAVTK